ncbi:hypothetical protein BD310DRAFT_1012210 [Dichomitus squalens]|uniref:Uncharacterized protein n=1 Tax=Dichomitus squalens TaxID=114155 RepID=A0A4Q9PX04_9APHY|nr:hypothetical protein BD310DRAFT_1012210 [Dichomitus squalens]
MSSSTMPCATSVRIATTSIPDVPLWIKNHFHTYDRPECMLVCGRNPYRGGSGSEASVSLP